ncbi:hypothetical protein B0H21DRAFT_823428 [Amylocystis lapponica]|nr:hypothetical protein B0H21DRAFT_823428 [Amylocystis lapponica]
MAQSYPGNNLEDSGRKSWRTKLDSVRRAFHLGLARENAELKRALADSEAREGLARGDGLAGRVVGDKIAIWQRQLIEDELRRVRYSYSELQRVRGAEAQLPLDDGRTGDSEHVAD